VASLSTQFCTRLRDRLKRARARVRSRRGAAAVEFAILALPFMMLLFALMEVMLIFFLQTSLEAAVAQTSRDIRTGLSRPYLPPAPPAPSSPPPSSVSRSDFRNAVCARMWGMADCTNRLFIMVHALPAGTTTVPTGSWADGSMTRDASGDEPFESSAAGQVVVVRAAYVWDLITPGLSAAFRNYGASSRVLVATTAFRNEPFN
jgi:TadE-like protein